MNILCLNYSFISLILISCFSCTQKIDKEKLFDLHCKIVETKNLCEKTESQVIVLKSTKAKEDTINKAEIQLQKTKLKLDSLLQLSEYNNYDSVENNLIKDFNLIEPSKAQIHFFKELYAYKIQRPIWQRCGGLAKLSNNLILREKKLKLIAKTKLTYENYINQKVTSKLRLAYPNLKENHYNSLEIITSKHLTNKDSYKQLKKDAYEQISKDSTLQKLYKEKREAIYTDFD